MSFVNIDRERFGRDASPLRRLTVAALIVGAGALGYLMLTSGGGCEGPGAAGDECGATPPAADPGPVQLGVAVDDCAPWDGPATSIYVSAAGALASLPPPEPYLQLVVYQPGARLPGSRVDLSRQNGTMGAGIAVRCVPGGECASTGVGTIEFESTAPGDALSGSYRLSFDGEPVKGAFLAHWIPRVATCG